MVTIFMAKMITYLENKKIKRALARKVLVNVHCTVRRNLQEACIYVFMLHCLEVKGSWLHVALATTSFVANCNGV